LARFYHLFDAILYRLILPFVLLRLILRSLRQPDYRKRLAERFGYYPFTLEKCLWIHAVSVGESLAALPLIQALKKRYPNDPILVTTTTPTGAARIRAALGDSVKHAYLPYDLPGAMRRFQNAMHPRLGIIMETEWWPNLLHISQERQIPICLLNARLSEQSARGYRYIAAFTQTMLSQMHSIAAQSQADAERLIALGAHPEKVTVTGNIKFDILPPADLAQQSQALRSELGENRLIWIAASTHEGEEAIILKAHQLICQKAPDTLLILVPRHPNRFAAVAKLCAADFITIKRSQQTTVTKETQVYLADTMGELFLLYSVSDMAFVAGSFMPIGGHNTLEPALLAKPIITGPHLHNFTEISALLISAKAQVIVKEAADLSIAILDLMAHPEKRSQMGESAKQVVRENQGALTKQLGIIEKILG
jgi:3-deoxy-D-manno-octulosonic-acid transferase